MNEATAPLAIKLYGSNISYFTGKLENYFRTRGIPYTLNAMQFPRDARRIGREVGVIQMPNVLLGDGRWMTDSSKIIQWFEEQYTPHPLLPQDPVLRFVCLLLEDYADEWLWRPAMHYRWHYRKGAALQSRHLAEELAGEMPLPGVLKRWNLRRRQRNYTTGDGITRANIAGVEGIYLRLLATLENLLATRDYMLGERPSVADIGFAGPFFRHFALDPVPLELMRERAPAVLEWVARLWNSPPERWSTRSEPVALPTDLAPLLDDIGQCYLPYLVANAEAVGNSQARFDAHIDGVDYRGALVSRYRVWCLQELRAQFQQLPEDAQQTLQALLQQHGCWEPLWQLSSLPLLPGQEAGLPFKAHAKMLAVHD